ncbi:Scr1 family TA system antitoxin-like transcriptional regulator [Actinomadura adrarensis]|uniref:Scr1 family TA system antitoxin-like transcriptional regulator n=1 Tax=Actinomadura adrarensis TaxID=1819600 RepID=A0ABW3C9U7_9ACTN
MANNHMTPRGFLAKEIRRLREKTISPETGKAMTRRDLAKSVHRSEELVKAWENGRRVPQEDDVELLDELFDTKGVLLNLRNELVKDERAPKWVDKWVDIATSSSLLRWHHPLLIPGLLQTPEYARAVIMSSGRQVDDVESEVRERIDRQKILAPENGTSFVAVIDEGVLYRPIGGAATMRAQLLKLLEVAEQPNVRVNIVPMNVGEYAGLAGNFALAIMDGRGFAYVDDAFSGDVLEYSEDVATMEQIWEALRDEALPMKQSIELIAEAVERWKT